MICLKLGSFSISARGKMRELGHEQGVEMAIGFGGESLESPRRSSSSAWDNKDACGVRVTHDVWPSRTFRNEDFGRSGTPSLIG